MVRLTASEKGYLTSLITNGQWPQARKADTGMVASDDCLLCGARGTLLHRHCDCDAWQEVLTAPRAVAALRARADLQEVTMLLERCLWPAQVGLGRPTPSSHICWRGQHEGFVPPGEAYLDGSAFEVQYDGYAAVGWSLVVLRPDGDEYLMSVSGQLCEPYVDINGGELMAFIMLLRFGMAPVVAVVDSKYVYNGVMRSGRAVTTRYCHTWAHLWRVAWDLIDDLGGVGDGGVRVRWVRAHQTQRQVRDGTIAYRDWLGNKYADEAARSAAEAGRIAADDRAKLRAERALVDGVAMWCSAVGSWIHGRDTCHRRAKPQRAVEGRAAKQVPAVSTCTLRGPSGKQWCMHCRWRGRQGVCPGSILEAAKQANDMLRCRGLPAHRLARIDPQVDAQLERRMPLVACLRCGATGAARASSFTRRCEAPTAAGRAALARLEGKMAPKVANKVAIQVSDLEADGAAAELETTAGAPELAADGAAGAAAPPTTPGEGEAEGEGQGGASSPRGVEGPPVRRHQGPPPRAHRPAGGGEEEAEASDEAAEAARRGAVVASLLAAYRRGRDAAERSEGAAVRTPCAGGPQGATPGRAAGFASDSGGEGPREASAEPAPGGAARPEGLG